MQAITQVCDAYDQFSAMLTNFTKQYFPPVAQNTTEKLIKTAPIWISVTLLPNSISRFIIPGAACITPKQTVAEHTSNDFANRLYDAALHAAIINGLWDTFIERSLRLATVDACFAIALYARTTKL